MASQIVHCYRNCNYFQDNNVALPDVPKDHTRFTINLQESPLDGAISRSDRTLRECCGICLPRQHHNSATHLMADLFHDDSVVGSSP